MTDPLTLEERILAGRLSLTLFCEIKLPDDGSDDKAVSAVAFAAARDLVKDYRGRPEALCELYDLDPLVFFGLGGLEGLTSSGPGDEDDKYFRQSPAVRSIIFPYLDPFSDPETPEP
jgi:hypothetical protein